jgi:hypothetical protein
MEVNGDQSIAIRIVGIFRYVGLLNFEIRKLAMIIAREIIEKFGSKIGGISRRRVIKLIQFLFLTKYNPGMNAMKKVVGKFKVRLGR